MKNDAKYQREYMREYYKRPEAKEKLKKYLKEYYKRPEVIERVKKRCEEEREKINEQKRNRNELFNNLIFNIHKEDIIEDTIRYKKDLRQKYDLSVNEAHDLFARIVNYQIDKYGYQMQKYVDDTTKDTYYHKNRNFNQRKYMRTKE